MTLDASGREANVRDSVKKFFVDNLKKAHGIELTFDKTLATPNIQGTEIDRWVSINFGELNMSKLAALNLEIFCCTRKDPEGFRLAQLRDRVFELLTYTKMRLYQSHPSNAWVDIGALMVVDIQEFPSMTFQDNTKFRQMRVLLKWGIKDLI